jgi:cytochrome c-type biogenesis protein CcmH/NrfG
MRTILGLVLCALVSLGIDPPNVPEIDTSSFSPAVKAQIERAESEAKARPQDANVIANLGMVLDAYDRYAAAARAYSRALALEPQNFDWASLLGRTELERPV